MGTSLAAYAASVNLVVKNEGAVVFSGDIPLPEDGTININDTEGNPHPANARSVLSVVNDADQTTGDFSISSLIYYSSFNAFYLKCMTVAEGGELCDNWQYKVDGDDPGVGMDNKTLSGDEDVVLFFGEENPDPAPEPEPEPEPEPAPAPEERRETSFSSGSRPRRSSRVPAAPVEAAVPATATPIEEKPLTPEEPKVVAPIPVVVSTSAPAVKKEAKKPARNATPARSSYSVSGGHSVAGGEVKKPAKKPESKKEVVSLGADNLAAPIAATLPYEVKTAPPKKENILWRFFKRLFGF